MHGLPIRHFPNSTTPLEQVVSGFKFQVSGRFAAILKPETWNLKRGEEAAGLRRALGAWDGALITIGAVLGTAIFLTPADIARALPHPVLILGAWVFGGLLTLAGALTYAEMGAMFPRAGGVPLWLGLLSGHHVGRHRGARGGFRGVPGRVHPVLFDAPRSRVPPDGELDLAAHRRRNRGSLRDRVPDRCQLRRRQGGRLAPEPRHDPEDRIPWGPGRDRPLRRCSGPAGSGGAASAGTARSLRHRHDLSAVGLRRLVLLCSIGGRSARSRPQHPARPHRRDRSAHSNLR